MSFWARKRESDPKALSLSLSLFDCARARNLRKDLGLIARHDSVCNSCIRRRDPHQIFSFWPGELFLQPARNHPSLSSKEFSSQLSQPLSINFMLFSIDNWFEGTSNPVNFIFHPPNLFSCQGRFDMQLILYWLVPSNLILNNQLIHICEHEERRTKYICAKKVYIYIYIYHQEYLVVNTTSCSNIINLPTNPTSSKYFFIFKSISSNATSKHSTILSLGGQPSSSAWV